jgi:uncharacterized membrane protein YhaH (DUF805 family)
MGKMIAIASYLFFSTAGRISRASWWIGVGALIILNLVLFFVLWTILGPALIANFFGRLIWLCVTALNIYAVYCLSAKRFQDRDRSALNARIVAGVWAAKAVLDLFRITGDLGDPGALDQLFVLAGTGIALWYFIELGWLEGTPGPNRYGEAAVDLAAPPPAV